MPRVLIIATALAGALLIWLWASSSFDALAAWAAGEQRGFQNQMAQGLRALRAGEPGAITALLSVCFAYGFFHAIGPGHGKVLIGGYGLGRQVPWLRLSVISLLSSLGQAVTAIVIVVAGITLLGLARDQMVSLTEDIMAPASYGAIGLIGGWLMWRGLRTSWASANTIYGHTHNHNHSHSADGTCHSCGHKHGPDLEDVENTRSLREAVILIAGIAIRPCTGALFILIITWQMGIFAAGIAGAFAMALGTAAVTVGVAIASVSMRGGLMGGLQGSTVLTWVIPAIEIFAGLLIAVIATGLFLRAIA